MNGSVDVTAQRYKMTLAYDGSAYAGWQVQPAERTVQGEVERAIAAIANEQTKAHSSGRTDQGVHARGQVVHFDLQRALSEWHFKKGLNAVLPADIRVLKIEKADPEFHARRSAVGKEYRYFIWNDEVMLPFNRRYMAHIRKPLDVTAMNAAARLLVGRHDFASFTANPNRVVESTVRNLTMLRAVKRGREITVIARSDGFLYKMVRSLCGFLIRVGEGAVLAEEARHILGSKLRTARVPTAAPEGLFLWHVTY